MIITRIAIGVAEKKVSTQTCHYDEYQGPLAGQNKRHQGVLFTSHSRELCKMGENPRHLLLNYML